MATLIELRDIETHLKVAGAPAAKAKQQQYVPRKLDDVELEGGSVDTATKDDTDNAANGIKLNANATEFVPRFKRNDEGKAELNLEALKRHFESMDQKRNNRVSQSVPIISAASLEQSLIKLSLAKQKNSIPSWQGFPKMLSGATNVKQPNKRVISLDEGNIYNNPNSKRARRDKLGLRGLDTGIGWDPELKSLCGRKFESEDKKREHERNVALEALKLVEQRRARTKLEAGTDDEADKKPQKFEPIRHISYSPLRFTDEERERVDRLRISKKQRIERVLREMQLEAGLQLEQQDTVVEHTLEAEVQEDDNKSAKRADGKKDETKANPFKGDAYNKTAIGGKSTANKKKNNKEPGKTNNALVARKFSKQLESQNLDDFFNNPLNFPNKLWENGSAQQQQQQQQHLHDRSYAKINCRQHMEKENYKQMLGHQSGYNKQHGPPAPLMGMHAMAADCKHSDQSVYRDSGSGSLLCPDYMRFKPFNPRTLQKSTVLENNLMMTPQPTAATPASRSRTRKHNGGEQRNNQMQCDDEMQYPGTGYLSSNYFARDKYGTKQYGTRQQAVMSSPLEPRVPYNTPTSTPNSARNKAYAEGQQKVNTKYSRQLMNAAMQGVPAVIGKIARHKPANGNDYRALNINFAGVGNQQQQQQMRKKTTTNAANEVKSEGGKKTYELSKLLEIKNEMSKTYAQVVGSGSVSGGGGGGGGDGGGGVGAGRSGMLCRSASGDSTTSGMGSSLSGNISARSYGVVSSLSSSSTTSTGTVHTQSHTYYYAAGSAANNVSLNPKNMLQKYDPRKPSTQATAAAQRPMRKSVHFNDVGNETYETAKSGKKKSSGVDKLTYAQAMMPKGGIMRYSISDLLQMVPDGDNLSAPRLSNKLRKFEFLRI